MGFQLGTSEYIEYLKKAHARIHADGEYITALDAATGDGDHWTNLNMGFEKLVSMADELSALNLSDAFKKIGMTMMSVIGGSSGALYGSAYMEAAKKTAGKTALDSEGLCEVLEAMLGGIMNRGKSEPGFKTMIDALYPAVQCYRDCLGRNEDERMTMELVKQAAMEGARSTKDMEAVKGRAYYQANKGVGHIDPGALTMAYQIEILTDYIADSLLV